MVVFINRQSDNLTKMPQIFLEKVGGVKFKLNFTNTLDRRYPRLLYSGNQHNFF